MNKKTFRDKAIAKQIAWRKSVCSDISSEEWGLYNKTEYEHIVPKEKWQETLWSEIRDILPAYLKESTIQRHSAVNHLNSSWALCANLYFPVRIYPFMKDIMLGFLRQKISPSIVSIDEIEMEFSFPDGDQLNPSILLGEKNGNRGTGQTSPDIALVVSTNSGKGVLLTECKYTEDNFYPCSARRKDDRLGNPDPLRCIVKADLTCYHDICHQLKWKRQYWKIILLSKDGNHVLNRCPAATDGYQLFRQQALAEGIAASGRYDFVANTVAYDKDNTPLINCLRTTGVPDWINDWGKMFDGKTLFKAWTHQEWVQFVRENQQNGQCDDWLRYVHSRYGY
ncbi:MAG: hypothetical protein LHW64_09925 [Candidatus Cloacimonetes bacterium]|nr:hypothetical protein [Candidatus Cloacimonadota bacterium]MDY0230429.1 hypothetical protein [Candidatus Cloacimonadaceae bacterium]